MNGCYSVIINQSECDYDLWLTNENELWLGQWRIFKQRVENLLTLAVQWIHLIQDQQAATQSDTSNENQQAKHKWSNKDNKGSIHSPYTQKTIHGLEKTNTSSTI